jgi:putative selenate reductase molybdopterin-binding subunit
MSDSSGTRRGSEKSREGSPSSYQVVGKSERKIDSLALAAGRAAFTDDVVIPGMLHAKLLWSPHAHARIRRIDAQKARELPGVVCVLTHEDVPRVLHTTAGQGCPEPSPYDTPMLDAKVRYVGDRVAAVAAESRAIAERAVKLIEVDYEPLPAVFDLREADAPGAPVIHDEPDCRAVIPVPYAPSRNIAAQVQMKVGDFDGAFAASEITVDLETESHYGHHASIEPHITICYLDDYGRLVIRTSTQVPFHVRRIVAQSTTHPLHRIRVIKPRIGGGFGGKQEVLEDIVAMLCLRSGRPVKLEYTRAEEFVSTRTRHPSVVRVKAGFDKGGAMKALQMRARTNTGAYGSHALTVVCNAGAKTLPLYRCENLGFEADSVYTNLPVAGAYRGYGGTQGAFALEIVMDEAANKLGVDPVELRQRLHIQAGEGSPVFRALGEGKEGVDQRIGSCGLDRCLELGAEAIDWRARRAEPRGQGRRRRGVGMCALMQGSSIPEVDMGAASIKMNDDGSFNLLIGATDLGTGSDTVLAQIAAEALATSLDKIIVYSSDTDLTPFDVGAYASSTTYLSGQAVRDTAFRVRDQIVEVAAQALGADPGAVELAAGVARAGGESLSYSQIARRALYEQDQFQIGAIGSAISHVSPPPFAAHFAEVEVDTRTGLVQVLKYVAAVDCGTAINPKLAEGQIEGAVMNGIGYALTEEMCFNAEGRCLNASFRHYRIPGPRDLPELRTILVPTHEPTGPYGAKSVSEICINGPLPALSNAIFHAIGIRMLRSPFTAERVWRAFRDQKTRD